jgi:hypothetical protein
MENDQTAVDYEVDEDLSITSENSKYTRKENSISGSSSFEKSADVNTVHDSHEALASGSSDVSEAVVQDPIGESGGVVGLGDIGSGDGGVGEGSAARERKLMSFIKQQKLAMRKLELKLKEWSKVRRVHLVGANLSTSSKVMSIPLEKILRFSYRLAIKFHFTYYNMASCRSIPIQNVAREPSPICL